MTQEKLLNVKESAKFLGISVITLWRKLGRGKGNKKVIGSYRIGRRILLSKDKHLIPYLAQCEDKAEG